MNTTLNKNIRKAPVLRFLLLYSTRGDSVLKALDDSCSLSQAVNLFHLYQYF